MSWLSNSRGKQWNRLPGEAVELPPPALFKSKWRKPPSKMLNVRRQKRAVWVFQPHKMLQDFSFSPRRQQGCWAHRLHTNYFTFNSLSRIKQGKRFKVKTLILICVTKKTSFFGKYIKFLFAEHPSQHYHSMPTQYISYITHYNKASQQNNGHKFKPRVSSATVNGIRHGNPDFQRQMKALSTFEVR